METQNFSQLDLATERMYRNSVTTGKGNIGIRKHLSNEVSILKMIYLYHAMGLDILCDQDICFTQDLTVL